MLNNCPDSYTIMLWKDFLDQLKFAWASMGKTERVAHKYRNMPNKGAGRDSKVESDIMQ